MAQASIEWDSLHSFLWQVQLKAAGAILAFVYLVVITFNCYNLETQEDDVKLKSPFYLKKFQLDQHD